MDVRIPARTLNHKVDLQVRFGDFDMFGHINNTVYLQYFDLGKALFFNDILGGDFSPESVSAVIVNINTNFYQPTAPGEALQVLTGCVRLGERSLTLHQQVVNPATGAVKADALTVMAGFDLRTQSSGPLPAPLRAALSATD